MSKTKYVTLTFTEKQLSDLMDGIDSYRSVMGDASDSYAQAEAKRAIKAFDTALAKIGRKRRYN